MSMTFSADEEFAKQLDAEDPLRSFRDKFHLPLGKDGKPLIYFAGNSLGLMPKSARKLSIKSWTIGQDLEWTRIWTPRRRGTPITSRCANQPRGSSALNQSK